MEMKMGNSVMSPGRRRFLNIEGDVVDAKCIKRRRRDPLGVAVSSNDQQHGKQQQQQTQQGDHQTATPTATTVKRSSRFRGVSRHRWTGRYEAHLWDKGSWNPTQRKKGKQVYLGAYDDEESAARAYDLAALKYWGTSTFTNFPVSEYEKELEMMKNMTKEEYLATLRRRSSGFSRGVSKYRGVARHHHNGRWEARIGRVFGNKYLYLGTYSTQEEAAHAYDIAAIEYRGINAVTNFDLSTYIRWLKPDANAPEETKPVSAPNLSNQIPGEKENQLSILRQPNPYVTHDLSTPKKQDIFQIKSPTSPSNKSSSALGLLLKSSVFKELVEKNLNTADEENEDIDTKIFPLAGNSDGVNDIFFSGLNQGSYVYPSDKDTVLPGLESKESKEESSKLSLYDGLDHSLWNGSFNFSSLQ